MRTAVAALFLLVASNVQAADKVNRARQYFNAAPMSTPPRPERPTRLWTWVMLGVTGALAVSAIGVGSYAVAEHDTLKRSCGMTAVGCSGSQLDGLRNITNATDGLIGVAAATAVITVVLAIVEPTRLRGHRRDRAQLTPAGLVF